MYFPFWSCIEDQNMNAFCDVQTRLFALRFTSEFVAGTLHFRIEDSSSARKRVRQFVATKKTISVEAINEELRSLTDRLTRSLTPVSCPCCPVTLAWPLCPYCTDGKGLGLVSSILMQYEDEFRITSSMVPKNDLCNSDRVSLRNECCRFKTFHYLLG